MKIEDFGKHMYEKEKYIRKLLDMQENETSAEVNFLTGRLIELQQLQSDWYHAFEVNYE